MLKFKLSNLTHCFPIATILVSLYAPNISAWTLEKNFNDGVHGENAQHNADSFDDAAGDSLYDSTQSFEGNMAAKLHINNDSTAYGRWGGVVIHPQTLAKGEEVWVRIRTYMPEGFDYDSSSEGGHLKFLRVHTQSESGSNQGCEQLDYL